MHRVDTQSDDPTDDLDTISGGTDGMFLMVRAENAARTVVVKDGTGNIELKGGDITLDDTDAFVILYYDGTLSKWVLAGGGGGAASTLIQEMHKITAGETTAGYLTLSQTPTTAGEVQVTIVGGPLQVNKQVVGATGAAPDFDVLSSNQLHFNNNGAATGLSGDMTTDDILIIVYTY